MVDSDPEHASAGGGRPVRFIRWAVDTFGSPAPGDDGLIVIATTQHELARAYQNTSPGTVAWYVSRLRAAGIVVDTRPLLVDPRALEGPGPTGTPSLIGEPTAPGRVEPVCDADRIAARGGAPAAGAGTLPWVLRQAQLMSRLTQLVAELASVQAELAEALADINVPVPAASNARDSASDRLAEPAPTRERRESIKEGSPGDDTSSFLVREPDANPRLAGTRGDSRTRTAGGGRERLSDTDVDRLVAPLRRLCRETGRSDRLDDRGRRVLAPLGHDALAAGVAAIQREAQGDPRIARPIGLLISRAQSRDPDTFAVQRSSPRQSTAPMRPWATNESEHAEITPAMVEHLGRLETSRSSANELAELDAVVDRILDTEGAPTWLRERVRTSPPMRTTYRLRAYQQPRARPGLAPIRTAVERLASRL